MAIDTGRALSLRYYTATRDETTDRIVDPLRVFELDGHDYLEAWCRRAEGMRLFRVDRIERVDVLDEPARPPAGVELRDLSEGVYTPAPEHLLAVLRVGPAYAWVADYYPSEETVEADGRHTISLRVADPAWVRALVLGSAGQVEVLAPGLAGRSDPGRGARRPRRIRRRRLHRVIVVIAWAIAAAVALVVGAVCAYEIRWKVSSAPSRRGRTRARRRSAQEPAS